jgi:3-oxoacyl-[acyl-carrier-protein] synthase II
MRRVVVTGLGAITPLGVGIRQTWKRLLASESGIVSVAHLEPAPKWRELPSTVAGLVPQGSKGEYKWQASDWLEKGAERRMAKFTQYAMAATEMALVDAGWRPHKQEDKEMTGVCLGSGIGNLEELYNTSIAYDKAVSYKWRCFYEKQVLRSVCRVIRRSLPSSSLNFSSILVRVIFR